MSEQLGLGSGIDWSSAFNIPLKLKHRNPDRRILHRPGDPPEGTLVFKAGRFGSKTQNAGKAVKGSTIRPRKRAYGPW